MLNDDESSTSAPTMSNAAAVDGRTPRRSEAPAKATAAASAATATSTLVDANQNPAVKIAATKSALIQEMPGNPPAEWAPWRATSYNHSPLIQGTCALARANGSYVGNA